MAKREISLVTVAALRRAMNECAEEGRFAVVLPDGSRALSVASIVMDGGVLTLGLSAEPKPEPRARGKAA